MAESFRGTYAYKTHVGMVRKNNEDQAVVLMNSDGDILLVVCDGMGGMQKGDVASRMAVDEFVKSFPDKKKSLMAGGDRRWLTNTCKKANNAIYETSERNPKYKGMGTTVVAALISGKRMTVALVGDSRCYSLDKNTLTQLTEDQTYVQMLINTGKITKEEALTHPERHVLTNAMGIYPSLSLDVKTFKYKGETILLCTDGLYNQVPDPEIKTVLGSDERPDQKVVSLIVTANAHGGSDNIGVAIWEAFTQ
ncbi:MAG: Stp1/IreP family PP2C-type Ser/Thr phosphatase [Bacilli bacterium]|nr:Stp1/IreP family PP2C-type Ser/Thr phosphatase [Bacilli bacterium]